LRPSSVFPSLAFIFRTSFPHSEIRFILSSLWFFWFVFTECPSLSEIYLVYSKL
jgi:hypothetical protein